jgi:transketolase
MRRTFFTALADLADKDDRIFLLTADIGYGVIDAFSDRHPDRFINCGVAEQNMIGVATGLADAGFIPFCYSITPFVTLRPLEFILRGPVLHNLPVRIVGAGRDQEYGVNGPTHWADDAGRVLDAIHLHSYWPETAGGVRACIETLLDTQSHPGPAFLSLSKNGCCV